MMCSGAHWCMWP